MAMLAQRSPERAQRATLWGTLESSSISIRICLPFIRLWFKERSGNREEHASRAWCHGDIPSGKCSASSSSK